MGEAEVLERPDTRRIEHPELRPIVGGILDYAHALAKASHLGQQFISRKELRKYQEGEFCKLRTELNTGISSADSDMVKYFVRGIEMLDALEMFYAPEENIKPLRTKVWDSVWRLGTGSPKDSMTKILATALALYQIVQGGPTYQTEQYIRSGVWKALAEDFGPVVGINDPKIDSPDDFMRTFLLGRPPKG